jgi:Protein of unknown function (DUF2510)
MTALPPAGWYPDPDTGGAQWRWWDGGQWWPTSFDSGAGAAALAQEAARKETQQFGSWLRWAMVANAVSSLLAYGGIAFIVHARAFHFFTTDPQGVVTVSHQFAAFEFVGLPLNLASLALLGTLIAWILQAGKFAEASRWPATRGRTLGAFSVLIPIVNLWWPYEAVRDAFPPGSRPPELLRWWLSYLALPFVAFALAVIAGFTAPTPVVFLVLIVDAFLLSLPVWFGWQVIRHMAAAQGRSGAS